MDSQPTSNRRWWCWTLGSLMIQILVIGLALAFLIQAESTAQQAWTAALSAEKQAIKHALADHRQARSTAPRAAQQGAYAQAAGHRVAVPVAPQPVAWPKDQPPDDQGPTPESVSEPESPRGRLQWLQVEQRRRAQEIRQLESELERETAAPEP